MTQAERLRRLRGRVPNVGDVQVEAGSVADVHRFVAVNCVLATAEHNEGSHSLHNCPCLC